MAVAAVLDSGFIYFRFNENNDTTITSLMISGGSGGGGSVHQPSAANLAAAQVPRQPAVPTRADVIPSGYVRDSSGYHFNPFTNHFFDSQTSYYFIIDRPNNRYLYYDCKIFYVFFYVCFCITFVCC